MTIVSPDVPNKILRKSAKSMAAMAAVPGQAPTVSPSRRGSRLRSLTPSGAEGSFQPGLPEVSYVSSLHIGTISLVYSSIDRSGVDILSYTGVVLILAISKLSRRGIIG